MDINMLEVSDFYEVSNSVDKPLTNLFYIDEKTIVLIEASSLYNASKSIGIDIDYKRLLELFKSLTRLVSINFYINVIDEKNSKLFPLVDWLSTNGYVTNVEYFENNRMDSNVSVRITTDLLNIAHSGRVDHIVLFSGNGIYEYVIKNMPKGIKVTLFSTKIKNNNSGSQASSTLLPVVNQFVDLNDIKNLINKIKVDE